jgi:putative ABC transport system permease protein
MGTVIRGIKNIFRNKFRNIAVILVLTLSLSLGLMMINMNFSSNNKIRNIKEKLGNEIDVYISNEYIESITDEKKGIWPRQEDYLFDENLADDILKIDSVKSITKSIAGDFISKKYKSEFADEPEAGMMTTSEGEEVDPTHWFSLFGIDGDANKSPAFQNGMYELVGGNFFKETDIEQNVALIGKKFAKRNNLNIGSEIIINREKIKVCGIYEIKKFFSESIYVPFKTAQRLLNLKDKVDYLRVTVDSIDNVEKTVNYINKKISDGKIIAKQDTSKYASILLSINSIKRISKVGMISAFAVGILVILSIMFINVRNRAREIGILKALGASNLNISTQFLVESVTLCTIALILSAVIILGTNQPISDFIVERVEGGDEEGVSVEEEATDITIELIPGAKLKRLEITFPLEIIIYSILITFLLGIVGSLIPAFYISKLRPAEVLRFE